MHYRRIACWLLGAWFIGSIAIYRITAVNFSAADRVLEAPVPEIHRVAIGRGRPVARGIMRYMAAELNRSYYSGWEWTQLLLGASVITVLLIDRQKRALMVLAASAMVLVAFQHFWVSPEIVYLEQVQSFPPKGPPPADFSFERVQLIYAVVEIAKLLMVLGLSILLVKMQGLKERRKVRRAAVVQEGDSTLGDLGNLMPAHRSPMALPPRE